MLAVYIGCIDWFQCGNGLNSQAGETHQVARTGFEGRYDNPNVRTAKTVVCTET